MLVLPGLTTLAGCSANSGGTEAWTVSVAVVLLGGTAVAVRRVTARPLERARDQAARHLSQVLDERAGLMAERTRVDGEREAQQRQLQAQAAEHQRLLRSYEELQQQQHDLTEQWSEAAAAHAGTVERLKSLRQEHSQLLSQRDGLEKERDDLQGSVDATFVNLAMRTLTLVERQLVLIETLEGREADATQLDNLFRLDHLATRMRRNSENMLLLAGLENSQRSRKTVTLLDVVRAAVSEIERYERVKLGFLAAVRLTGAVADDTSHLLAELLENATAFSPPQEQVEIGGWLLDNGELMVSVNDRGIGLPPDRMRALNEQLAEQLPSDSSERRDALMAGALTGRSMGLFVVARLAARHGLRVQLRENGQGGGVTAMVVLPREALQQDDVSTADLDDQRQAERSATAAAAQVRAVETRAAEAAAAAATAPAPAAPAPAAAPAPGVGELPALPRRRPAHAARPAAAEGGGGADATGLAENAVAESAASEAPAAGPAVASEAPAAFEASAAEPAAEPGAAAPGAAAPGAAAPGAAAPVSADSSPLDQPTQQLMIRHLHSQGEQLTELGLPRRVPRSTGLPGTGEAPASGLRRVTGASGPVHARPDATGGGASPADAEASSPRSRTSAEELRRRLGGFQSGLRQAARESAPEGSEGQNR
ncbi:signal transduction histidine kinase [Kitasatospora sp. GP30]|uniref:ATP-binding protein n=1 Tax=Kitasatospora sp. GP30 TaxID=3035084 RepID=UPI000C707E17|nr:ATP-binding protein [Kitasatospora sp. GP30]MDH6143015.1 signal transduction histidine kinase [Kitasatospora sp. GP30]